MEMTEGRSRRSLRPQKRHLVEVEDVFDSDDDRSSGSRRESSDDEDWEPEFEVLSHKREFKCDTLYDEPSQQAASDLEDESRLRTLAKQLVKDRDNTTGHCKKAKQSRILTDEQRLEKNARERQRRALTGSVINKRDRKKDGGGASWPRRIRSEEQKVRYREEKRKQREAFRKALKGGDPEAVDKHRIMVLQQYLSRQARYANNEDLKKEAHRKGALRARAKTLAETSEERETRLAEQREKYKKWREGMTEEQLLRYRETTRRCFARSKGQHKVASYSELSEEKKQKIKDYQKARMKKETPEQRQHRLNRLKRNQERRRQLLKLQQEQGYSKEEAEKHLQTARPELYQTTGRPGATAVSGPPRGRPYKPRHVPEDKRPLGRPKIITDEEVAEFIRNRNKTPGRTNRTNSKNHYEECDPQNNVLASESAVITTSAFTDSLSKKYTTDTIDGNSHMTRRDNRVNIPVTVENSEVQTKKQLTETLVTLEINCESSLRSPHCSGNLELNNDTDANEVSTRNFGVNCRSPIHSSSSEYASNEDCEDNPNAVISVKNMSDIMGVTVVQIVVKTNAEETAPGMPDVVDMENVSSNHLNVQHNADFGVPPEDELCSFLVKAKEKEDDDNNDCHYYEVNCGDGDYDRSNFDNPSNNLEQSQKDNQGESSKFQDVSSNPTEEGTERKKQQSKKGSRRQRQIFFCDQCGVHYGHMDRLKAHMETDHGSESKLFKCPAASCQKTFNHSYFLYSHYRSFHVVRSTEPKESENLTTLDDESNRRELLAMEDLQQLKDSTKKVCPYCGKRYSTVQTVLRHIGQVHNSDPSSFLCHHCEKTFLRKCALDDHIRRVHLGQVSRCDICNRAFQSITKLWRHQVQAHNMKDLDPKSLGIEVQECPFCDAKMFRGLKFHVEKEHPDQEGFLASLRTKILTKKRTESVFFCHKCNRTLWGKNRREQHMRRIHGEVEADSALSTCDKCNKPFISTKDLTLHALNFHKKLTKIIQDGVIIEDATETKRRKCYFCPVELPQDELFLYRMHLLENHIDDVLKDFRRRLVDEKNPPCPCCSVIASSRSQLLEHLKSCHPNDAQCTKFPSRSTRKKQEKKSVIRKRKAVTSNKPDSKKEIAKKEIETFSIGSSKKRDSFSAPPLRRSTRDRTTTRRLLVQMGNDFACNKPVEFIGSNLISDTSQPKPLLAKHIQPCVTDLISHLRNSFSTYETCMRYRIEHVQKKFAVVILTRLKDHETS